MTTLLHNVKDIDGGVEANIYANVDGVRFNVVFRDTDANETISTRIFGDLEAAKTYARELCSPAFGNVNVVL